MEVGDPGRSAGGRKRNRTVAVVPEVPDQSKGTGCESEGANGSELRISLALTLMTFC
jgi:hypothetical protein